MGFAARFAGLSLLFVLFFSCEAWASWRAGDAAAIAEELGDAAGKQRRLRVAVMPFRTVAGAPSLGGSIVSERLVSELMRRDDFELVERSRLQALIDEIVYGLSGAVDPPTAAQLGRFLGVDALVVGTAVKLRDGGLEVHVRMVEVESARVLAAANARIRRDWPDFGSEDLWAFAMRRFRGTVLDVSRFPSFARESGAADPWPGAEASRPLRALQDPPLGDDSLRDALGCANLDDGLLDAKAHRWALVMRLPGLFRQVMPDPGLALGDARLRARFYGLVRDWSSGKRLPPLSDADKALLARCR